MSLKNFLNASIVKTLIKNHKLVENPEQNSIFDNVFLNFPQDKKSDATPGLYLGINSAHFKPSCDTRFEPVFTACVCVFKVIMLV